MDAIYWHDGQWTTDNPKLLGPADHAFWMASMVFDGARAFRGLTPDLDLHCQRVVRSAEKMLMKPQLGWEAIQDLCLQAVAKFPEGTELYIKPMFYCADGFLLPDADRTQFVLHVFKVPMPGEQGFGLLLQLRALLVQHGAHRRQGVLPVPERPARHPRRGQPWLRQRHHAGRRRQHRRVRHQQPVDRQERRRQHARRQRHLPERHHAPPRAGAAWPTASKCRSAA